MAYVAKKDNILLMILQDEIEDSPRNGGENFGTMACWHSQYNLGDGNNGSSPKSYIEDIVLESMTTERIIKEARRELFVKIQYDRKNGGYDVLSRDKLNKDFSMYEFVEGKMEDMKEDLALEILRAMDMDTLLELARKTNVILPLFLYDHSLLSMSTQSFIGRAVHAEWDSGQVGFIHVSDEAIKSKYEKLTRETVTLATQELEQEVELYDCYLRGEGYGFKLFKDGEETDSCWGFLGGIDEVKNSIAYYLPDENKEMIEDLEYIEEYEVNDFEAEYEQEYAM